MRLYFNRFVFLCTLKKMFMVYVVGTCKIFSLLQQTSTANVYGAPSGSMLLNIHERIKVIELKWNADFFWIVVRSFVLSIFHISKNQKRVTKAKSCDHCEWNSTCACIYLLDSKMLRVQFVWQRDKLDLFFRKFSQKLFPVVTSMDFQGAFQSFLFFWWFKRIYKPIDKTFSLRNWLLVALSFWPPWKTSCLEKKNKEFKIEKVLFQNGTFT